MQRSDDTGAARQQVEPRSRTEYAADLERQVALVTFEPRRAGLPEVSITDGTAYLDKHHAERPWLSLREALADPGELPDNELFKAVQFSDGSNKAFLRRLWRDLYGDEPAAGA